MLLSQLCAERLAICDRFRRLLADCRPPVPRPGFFMPPHFISSTGLLAGSCHARSNILSFILGLASAPVTMVYVA
jgi:hypothetical protein